MANKTLEEYMQMPFRMVITPDTEEGGYTVHFPDLPGCLTCVDCLNDIDAAANDAKRAWLSAAIADGIL